MQQIKKQQEKQLLREQLEQKRQRQRQLGAKQPLHLRHAAMISAARDQREKAERKIAATAREMQRLRNARADVSNDRRVPLALVSSPSPWPVNPVVTPPQVRDPPQRVREKPSPPPNARADGALSMADLHTEKINNGNLTAPPVPDVKVSEPAPFEPRTELETKQVEPVQKGFIGRKEVPEIAQIPIQKLHQNQQNGRKNDTSLPYQDDIELLRVQLTNMADEAEVAANKLDNNVGIHRGYALHMYLRLLPLPGTKISLLCTWQLKRGAEAKADLEKVQKQLLAERQQLEETKREQETAQSTLAATQQRLQEYRAQVLQQHTEVEQLGAKQKVHAGQSELPHPNNCALHAS